MEEELQQLGAENTQQLSDAAVSFTASAPNVPLKILLGVRTAHRLLELLQVSPGIESREDVYDAVQEMQGIHVKDLLGDGKANCIKNTALYHSLVRQLTVKLLY